MKLFLVAHRQFISSMSIIGAASMMLLVSTLAYAYPQSMHISDYDGIANLNIARLISHSFTPGFSQVGTWNLLNHMIMAPVTAVSFWYVTGTAGFVVHAPLFFLGVYCVYRMCIEITDDEFASLIAAAVFAMNPFVLLMYVSPMSEPPFITLLAASGMFMAQWARNQSPPQLLLSAACIAIASIARFEGFALVPVGALVVFMTAIRWKYTWARTFSVLLLFLLMSAIGPAFVIAYSWFYTGNPLYFVSYTQASESTRGTTTAAVKILQRNWQNIFLARAHVFLPIFWNAFKSQFSAPVMLIAAFGMAWPIVKRRRWVFLVTIALLLAPNMFIFAAFLAAKRTVRTPPFSNDYINVRYVLQSIVLLSLLSGCAVAALRSSSFRIVRWMGMATACVTLVVISAFCAYEFFIGHFEPVRNNVSFAKVTTESTSLSDVYDYGNVLISHGNNETYLYRSYVPLERIVYESNFRYYEQASKEPWLFVRWVVLNDGRGARDQLSQTFFSRVRKDIFLQYYELVSDRQGKKVYRLRDKVVRSVAEDLGYDPELIPSINPSADWVPVEFYKKFRAR